MTTTYAIGDVHGRADLLAALLDYIEKHRAPNSRIVFLGDIIDRGPESRQAMDLVVETLAADPESRLILGNHEEFLDRFLRDPENRARAALEWERNGGLATLGSYGIGLDSSAERAMEHFGEIAPAHLDVLRNAVTMVETDTYLMVHAGIEPRIPIARQDPRTTRWIRREFLDYPDPLPKIVVHGHTPTGSNRPEVAANRIAVDTGAYSTGRLTCVLLDEPEPPAFFSAEGDGERVSVNAVEPVSIERERPDTPGYDW